MSWIVFPCRECGELQVARSSQQTKQCPRCNSRVVSKQSRGDGAGRLPVKRTRLFKSVSVAGSEGSTKTGSIGHSRVKILARFETFAEASDYLRFIKLPKELRDPKRVELYQSSAWRKAHEPKPEGGEE